eukprot:TRINITY_DN50291_c0_g1_i1.p1 TRINITY_DN50291_c0_g1~~TRINITY_DN50291_c0_g1_i1.p1  ORF type:complete len:415 (+),score=71.39 TRINITY_DN50291_c0_g1_i1:119-1363(+)
MRRAYRHAIDSGFLTSDVTWQEELRRIWFTRTNGRPSAFEHIFIGNLSEDSSGQPVAGGLHCWLKFYLEEVRGTAVYLGYVYNRKPKEGILDNRFVSGKFTWQHAGRRLLKDEGGFFVGVSPEWLLADGTVAYLETLDPATAPKYGWEPWLGARDTGYTKDVVHEGFKYRQVVCHSENKTLVTVFSSFLGAATSPQMPPEDSDDNLDRVLTLSELAQSLPTILVDEGIAKSKDGRFCTECVEFAAKRGCTTLREALKEVREALGFVFEKTAESSDAKLHKLLDDSDEVADVLLEEHRQDRLTSSNLPNILDLLKSQGRTGARVHRPLRLLLTGHASGAGVSDILRLLELAEVEGADERGPSLRDRLSIVQQVVTSRKQKQIRQRQPQVDSGVNAAEMPTGVNQQSFTAFSFQNI